MPTYAYRCTECGHAFDIRQEFSDSALTECPECGGRLRKQFNSIGVTFNGSGFYRTDSRAAAGGSGSGSSDSSSSTSSTSSPAAASASSGGSSSAS